MNKLVCVGSRGRGVPRIASIGAAVAVLLAAGSAYAGPPGEWTQITGAPAAARNTDQIGLARTSDGVLHIAYTVDPPGGPATLFHRSLSKNAKVLGPPGQIAQLATMNNAVVLGRTESGGLRVFFAGLTGAPAPDGFMRTATADQQGAVWSAVAPASNVATPPGPSRADAASGIAAAPAADGTPVTVWGDSAPGQAGYHVGLDPSVPDVKLYPGENRCCILNPAAALDSQSGKLFLAWVNMIGSPFIEVQSLGGAKSVAPASGAAQLQTRLGLAARAGGGMYLAYATGTNQYRGSPALWRVGDPKANVLAGQGGAQNIGLTRAPGGRLWMFWTRDGRPRATRTNKAATRFGPVVSLKPPKGATTLYRVTGDGSPGPLDAFALFDAGTGLAYWHQRVLPRLTLAASPSKVAAGKKITFQVADAGDAVQGAKVELKLGKAISGGTTSSNGTVKLAVPPNTKPGKYVAQAAKSGYAGAKRTIKVT